MTSSRLSDRKEGVSWKERSPSVPPSLFLTTRNEIRGKEGKEKSQKKRECLFLVNLSSEKNRRGEKENSPPFS